MTTDSKPRLDSVLTAVTITVCFWIITTSILLAYIENSHRIVNNLPDVTYKNFFGITKHKEAEVSLRELDSVEMAIFLIYFIMCPLIYPVIGRYETKIANYLAKMWDKVFFQKILIGQWKPEFSIIFGSGWPITIFSIPFLFIGLMIEMLYQSLWSSK